MSEKVISGQLWCLLSSYAYNCQKLCTVYLEKGAGWQFVWLRDPVLG